MLLDSHKWHWYWNANVYILFSLRKFNNNLFEYNYYFFVKRSTEKFYFISATPIRVYFSLNIVFRFLRLLRTNSTWRGYRIYFTQSAIGIHSGWKITRIKFWCNTLITSDTHTFPYKYLRSLQNWQQKKQRKKLGNGEASQPASRHLAHSTISSRGDVHIKLLLYHLTMLRKLSWKSSFIGNTVECVLKILKTY